MSISYEYKDSCYDGCQEYKTQDGYCFLLSWGKACWHRNKHCALDIGLLLQIWLLPQLPHRAVPSLTFPGGQEFHFPHFFLKISIHFSYFSSNLTSFLPHFGPPGGRLAHPGRPWLRHCSHKLFLYFRLSECV